MKFSDALRSRRSSGSRSLSPVAAVTAAVLLASFSTGWTRLDETEAQSKARYGEPNPAYVGAGDKPLLPGAKEEAYLFQGWRIRAAFVEGRTVRIEYVHVPEGGVPKKITAPELEAVLEAENGGKFSWREQKPRTGNKDLNALKTFFDGRRWKRSDHAEATLLQDLVMILETRDAGRLEKKLAANVSKPGAKAGSALPGF